MALRTNRLNAQGYASCIFAGGVEAWAVKRLDLLKNMYVDDGSTIDDRSGIPNGYNTGAKLLPLKSGGMSSYNPAIFNLVKLDADAKMGLALEGSSALTLTVVNAQADQIVALVGSASLALSASNADMSAGVDAVASSAMAFSSSVSLGGIIPVTATSTLTLTPNVDITALAFMEAEAGGPTELSPEGLASAVWNSDLVDYTESGTFGAFTQKVLTVARFIGLK